MITRKALQTKIYKTSSVALTSAYGTPRPGGRTHEGEDWDVTIADDHPKLYAPYNGIITYVRDILSSERGKIVEIKIAGTPWYALIQHDYKISVKKGQRVTAGTLIAIQGGSGTTINQFKSHVHIELSKRPYGDPLRKPVNPNVYFYPFFNPPKWPIKTVVVSDLRIRKGHSIDAEWTGKYADLKAYVIYDTVLEDGYYWGRIDWVLDLWIAIKTAAGKKVYAK